MRKRRIKPRGQLTRMPSCPLCGQPYFELSITQTSTKRLVCELHGWEWRITRCRPAKVQCAHCGHKLSADDIKEVELMTYPGMLALEAEV